MPHGAIRFPFGKCRVCQDQATGVHYGVATCEGCKGFFKRSTIRGEKYKCFFGGQCEITPQNRNRCKSCRFRLCLECGMSLEAVKMGRIPKLEKERALQLASRDGNLIGERVPVVNENGKGQKNSDSKTIKEESQSPDMVYDPTQTQMECTSLFSSADHNRPIYFDSEKAQLPIRSYDCSDRRQPKSDIFYDVGTSGSLSSNDSFTESLGSNLLQEDRNSRRNSWEPQPSYPAPVFESSHDITPLTFSSHPEQGAKMSAVPTQCSTVFKKFQMKSPPFSGGGVHRNRTNSSSLTDSEEDQHGMYLSKSAHNSDPISSLITIPHTESSPQYGTADSDESVKGELSPGQAESNLCSYDTTGGPSGAVADPLGVSSSSGSESSSIWDREILRKLQLNDNDFKMEFSSSEVYAPVRNHYKFLCDVEPGGTFNKLPLYIQTLQQLDMCQKNGVLLKLQETPSDMIDKICKTLTMEDKFAVSREGTLMGKDSTYLIQGTLQRLKYSMDLLWKPIWLMRQYVRQGLSSMPCSLVFTGDEKADLMETWPALMESVGFYNDVIMGFSFACPGFKNLQNDLKEYLIHRAYFDIWVLTMADFCIDGKCHFPLPNTKIYTNLTMKKILKENSLLEITSVLGKINRCQLCDLEIGLLCVIFLKDADDEKLAANPSMNLEPLRTLHSHYLDILATVVSKIHTTQSTKRLKDIFSLTPLIKKLSMRLQLQITLYDVEQVPNEDCLQTIALNTQATVEKINHTL